MVLYPQNVDFKFDAHLRLFFFIFGCMAVLLTFYIVISTWSSNPSWTTTMLTALSILCESCNPLVPVAIVWAQSVASHWLRTDLKGLEENAKIKCLVPPRISVAGKTHVIVFDKTGTITKDGMDFMGVLPAENGNFKEEVVIDDCPNLGWMNKLSTALQYALGVCHTVTTLESDGSFVGNHVEVSMVESSGWTLPPPNATEKNFSPPQQIRGLSGCKVIRELPFDHHRMTSGVVAKLSDGTIQVLMKGSYERVGAISTKESVPKSFVKVTEGLAADSFYVLGVAARTLDGDANVTEISRDELESGLCFTGLLMFRNEIKYDSPQAIQELRDG